MENSIIYGLHMLHEYPNGDYPITLITAVSGEQRTLEGLRYLLKEKYNLAKVIIFCYENNEIIESEISKIEKSKISVISISNN